MLLSSQNIYQEKINSLKKSADKIIKESEEEPALNKVLDAVDLILKDPQAYRQQGLLRFLTLHYQDVYPIIDDLTKEDYPFDKWVTLVNFCIEYIIQNPSIINYLIIQNQLNDTRYFFVRSNNTWQRTDKLPELPNLPNFPVYVAKSSDLYKLELPFYEVTFVLDLENMRKVIEEANESVGIGYKQSSDELEL